MKKKSRTGKKKTSQYGPGGSKVDKNVQTRSPEEIQMERKRSRLNVFALILLSVALVLIFFAPKLTEMGVPYILGNGIAYLLTLISGAIMLLSVKFVAGGRTTSTRLTGWLMIFVGAFGLVYTLIGPRVP